METQFTTPSSSLSSSQGNASTANISSRHLPRRISIADPDHRGKKEFAEKRFLDLAGPLILLGEPGMGKTSIVKEYAKRTGAQLCLAYPLPPVVSGGTPQAKTVIDGIDEAIYSGGNADIPQAVWDRILKSGNPNFVLTCRTAEWKEKFGEALQHYCRISPTVGRICPLSDDEICEFIHMLNPSIVGDEFLDEMRQGDAFGLARNPLWLSWFLSKFATNNGNWPESKLELYELACACLAIEHGNFDPRHTPEDLMRVAGFIFVQQLLSGAGGQADKQENAPAPRVSDWIGDHHGGIKLFEEALSSKLFCHEPGHSPHPYHRTVAEYLAAKWIAEQMKETLSPKRIECLLVRDGIVPSGLRGLHAWIATLVPDLTRRFIGRDPYGFLTYGDPSALAIEDAEFLFGELDKKGKKDPFLFAKDLDINFGRGLAKPELKDEVSRRLSNPRTTPLLQCVLLEAAASPTLFDDMKEQVESTLLKETTSYALRFKALIALANGKKFPGWTKLVDVLLEHESLDSTRLAMEIMSNKTRISAFLPSAIVAGFRQFHLQTEEKGFISVPPKIESIMSNEQLLKGLTELCAGNSEGDTQWIALFMEELLSRGVPPTPEIAFRALHISSYQGAHSYDWENVLSKYLETHPNYKRNIQKEALISGSSNVIATLLEINNSLLPTTEDAILMMTFLVENPSHIPEWGEKWECVVRWSHSDATARKHAQAQTCKDASLRARLKRILDPPRIAAGTSQKEYELKLQREKIETQRKLRETFSAAHKSSPLELGENLQVLEEISGAYLGWYGNIEGDTPDDRLTYLVGKELAPAALEGICKATTNEKYFRSAREIAESEADTRKSGNYIYSGVLLAYCEMQQPHGIEDALREDLRARGKSDGQAEGMTKKILTSALASIYWHPPIGTEKRKELEDVVFSDPHLKEKFLRDMIEPFLEAKNQYHPLFDAFPTDARLADISPRLGLEWISTNKKISGRNLNLLLRAAVREPGQKTKDLITSGLAEKSELGIQQRGAYIGAAFVSDFASNRERLSQLVAENKEYIWDLRNAVSRDSLELMCGAELDAERNYFLIDSFAVAWPLEDHPGGVQVGDNNAWNASWFLQSRISALEKDLTDNASQRLKELSEKEFLGGYEDHIKNAYEKQRREKAEAKWQRQPLTRKEVRDYLLTGCPERPDQLQVSVLDAFEDLQEQIRGSNTSTIDIYWGNGKPHCENYCRDRIVEGIKPLLEPLDVFVSHESPSAEKGISDISFSLLNGAKLPCEVKGQWHRDLWTAADDQLLKYSREYGAEGYGIYLALWFGESEEKPLRPPPGKKPHPKNANELEDALSRKVTSEKIKVFVLDLSRHGGGSPAMAQKHEHE